VKFKRRNLWLVLIILLYSALVVTPVFAHALLLRSNPAANAVLTQPPVQVELFFSESVDGTLSDIKVYNTSGSQVDVGDVSADRMHLVVLEDRGVRRLLLVEGDVEDRVQAVIARQHATQLTFLDADCMRRPAAV